MKRWLNMLICLVVLWFARTAVLTVSAEQAGNPVATLNVGDYQAYRSKSDVNLPFDLGLMSDIARSADQRGPDGLTSGPEAVPGCLNPIGHWPYGPTYAGTVSGNYAYYGQGAILTIAEVSDPYSAQIIGGVEVYGTIRGIAISGTRAYVAAARAGFHVVDISDRTSPSIIGTVDTPGEARALAVSGNYVYLADAATGLLVFDVSNPASPTQIGSFNTSGSATGLVLAGNRAYVADGASGLHVIDISNPASPTLLGTYNSPGYAYDVWVSGNLAYLADGTSGLGVVDISNSAAPVSVGTFDTPGQAVALAVSGNYAYVADSFSGLRVIDISNPASPTEVGSAPSYDYASDVQVSGNYAYLADRSTVQVLNVSNPASPIQMVAWSGYGNAWGNAIAGDYLYVAEGAGGLTAYDVSSPGDPVVKGFYDTPGFAYDVVVVGSVAYVADSDSGLQILDLADPANPVPVSFYDTPGLAYSVTISGKYAYVADGTSGLQIVDISNPAAPKSIGSFDTPGYAYGVAISGDLAYVADGTSGVRIINISNPASPTEVGFCDTPGSAYDLALSGGYAYVADYQSGLRVVDVSNPASPTIVSFLNIIAGGLALRIQVAGGYAYIGAGPAGLQVADVSNPTSPKWAGSANTSDYATGVTVSNDRIYVADAGCGFYVFSGCGTITECLTVSILSMSTSSCPTVKIEISVTASSGQPVTGLTGGAFTLSEDGVGKSFASTALSTAGRYQLSYTSTKNDTSQHALDVGVTVDECVRHATANLTLCSISTVSYEADVAPRASGGDGLVNTADREQIGRFAAALDSAVAGTELRKADCAPKSSLGNGTITTVDWVQAARYAAGLDPLTPVGGPSSATAAKTDGAPVFQADAPATVRTLAVSQLTINSGQTASIPIILQSAGDENALGFSVSFDPALLTFTSATLGSGVTGGSVIVNDSQKASGKVGVIVGRPAGQTFSAGQRQAAVLNFSATTTSGNRSATVSFGDQPVIREVSDVAASAIACTYYEGSIAITTATPVYSQRLVFPQFVDGGGMTTRFAVFASPNLPDAVVGRIRFYNSDATPRSVMVGGITGTERLFSLDPHGSQFTSTVDPGGQAVPGWALVETTGLVHGMAGFEFRAGTTLLFSASALGMPPSRTVAIPVENATKTGVAIVNPGDAPVNVRLTLMDKSGAGTIMNPSSLNPLGAKRHLPQFVNEMTGRADFQGTLVIEVIGNGSIAVTGLYLNEGILSGLPVVILQ